MYADSAENVSFQNCTKTTLSMGEYHTYYIPVPTETSPHFCRSHFRRLHVTVQIPAYKGDLTQFQPLEYEEDEESEDPNQNTGNVETTYEAPQLPTPEATPGPEPSEESLNQERQEDRYPLKEICGDIDESNIVKGPRTRKPRREAYLVELTKPPTSLSGYLLVFTASLMKGKANDILEKQIHRENSFRLHLDLGKS
ncbi:hypothetical protein V8E54_007274 [Elaphomyces granulatus]